MKKKFLKSTLVVVAVALAGMGTVKAYVGDRGSNELLAKNVEALSAIEISTTWSCSSANSNPCGAMCGACGTRVIGSGSLTGTHSCSINK